MRDVDDGLVRETPMSLNWKFKSRQGPPHVAEWQNLEGRGDISNVHC